MFSGSKKEGEEETHEGTQRLQWSDNGTNDKTKLQTLTIPYEMVIKKGKVVNTKKSTRSLLKVSMKIAACFDKALGSE